VQFKERNVLQLSIHPTLARVAKRLMGKIGFGVVRPANKTWLEIRCLALVDVADAAAYSIEAVQTPSGMKGS
jgi:hypothetical protein